MYRHGNACCSRYSVCIILNVWIEAKYVRWCQVKLWSHLYGKILIAQWLCKVVWILKEFWSIHTLSLVWPAYKALAINRTAGVLFPHLIPSTCGRFKFGSLQVPVLWLPPAILQQFPCSVHMQAMRNNTQIHNKFWQAILLMDTLIWTIDEIMCLIAVCNCWSWKDGEWNHSMGSPMDGTPHAVILITILSWSYIGPVQ